MQKICEKPQVVNEYESGKAIPNQAVLSKLERALGEWLSSDATAVTQQSTHQVPVCQYFTLNVNISHYLSIYDTVCDVCQPLGQAPVSSIPAT